MAGNSPCETYRKCRDTGPSVNKHRYNVFHDRMGKCMCFVSSTIKATPVASLNANYVLLLLLFSYDGS